MLNLSSSAILRLVPTIAGSLKVSGSTIDINPSTNPATIAANEITLAAITTTTTTTIVASPAASFTRNVKQLTVKNDGVDVHSFTIQQVNGGNVVTKWSGFLDPGNWLELDETGQWLVYDGFSGLALAATAPAVSGSEPTPISSAALISLRASIEITPATAPPHGTPYVLTDGVLIGQVVRWDGDKFAYNGAFGKYGVVTTITSNNTDDTVAKIAETIDLPVFAIGKNTKVTINPLWTFSSTAVSNGNVISCFYGTTGGEVNAGAPSTATNATMDVLHRIQMNNSLTAQTIVNSGGIGGSGALLTGAQDFKTLMKVRLRCNWSANQATTQTIVLQGYTVRLEG